MNGKRWKDVICGAAVVTLAIGVAPVAFAKVGGERIPVVYNNIKVFVEGNAVKSEKEPFTYEGTTYLPVRAVAEAVGKDVTWDSATQTVALKSVKEEVKEEAKEEVKEEAKEEVKEEAKEEVKEEAKEEVKEEEKEKADTVLSVTEEDKLIYNANNLKITYKGTRDMKSGNKEMKMLIENMTERELNFGVKSFYVDGTLIDAVLYCNVPAGKKAVTEIILSEKSLTKNNVKTIKNFKFEFSVSDPEDWTYRYNTGIVIFKK